MPDETGRPKDAWKSTLAALSSTLAFRRVPLQRKLFAEILKVGVPGLINVFITNLSVVLLTGIAGHLGRAAAIGYAMGARLEYILIPLAFGFGTTIVAMVGTNWGAKQYRRARAIAWTGAATVAAACVTIGLVVALFPGLWMGLFSDDQEIVRVGASYLRIVGPIYGLYGLGMALYFATQGFGSVIWTVTANAVRLIASAGCALAAIHWLDLGAIGFFAAIAGGFCAYAALTAIAMIRVKEPFSAPYATTNIGGERSASKLRRWWLDCDNSRIALAGLGDDQLCNLSDRGRQMRREAQREVRQAKDKGVSLNYS
jgi:Na+-driven multidrug efflux pump